MAAPLAHKVQDNICSIATKRLTCHLATTPFSCVIIEIRSHGGRDTVVAGVDMRSVVAEKQAAVHAKRAKATRFVRRQQARPGRWRYV